jgi:hypothetical protein
MWQTGTRWSGDTAGLHQMKVKQWLDTGAGQSDAQLQALPPEWNQVTVMDCLALALARWSRSALL